MQDQNNEHHADKWTNLSAFGEALASLSDAYLWACLYDLFTGSKKQIFGVSWAGLFFGLAIAALSAGGAANCHRTVDGKFQTDNQKTKTDLEQQELPQAYKPLSIIQIFSLIGDLIAHSADISDPLGLLAFLLFSLILGNLPTWAKMVIQTCIVIIGVIGSLASVRTCKNSMIEVNNPKIKKNEQDQKNNIHKADALTESAAGIGGVSSFVSGAAWLAFSIDLFGGFNPEFAGASYPAIAAALTASFFTSVSVTLLRRKLNINHQHHHGVEEKPKQLLDLKTEASNSPKNVKDESFIIKLKSLTKVERVALFFAFISRAGEIAGALSIIVKLNADVLSINDQRIFQSAITFFGGLASLGSTRTLMNNILNDSSKNLSEEEHQPLLINHT